MSYRKTSPLNLVFAFVLALAIGCTSTPTRTSGPSGPGGPTIEPTPPTQDTGTSVINERRIGLVLGGAGVASFATVGILKRLQQEGINVDFIVSTGWPALFSLGYGFLKSVHDLEWFAMRLNEKDFYAAGLFEVTREYASHDKLSTLIENAFPQKDLSDSKLPVLISATNIEPGEP